MTAIARVQAQAKVNLFLRILAREETGYHALETLFARITLADEITVRPTAGARTIDTAGAEVGPAEANLAYRAAMAFAASAGWPAGFAIEIEKRIPVGGGLGGGSADAGAVLRALNALAPKPLELAALLEIAGTLGADVPFMTLEAPLALGWGRGDRLLALSPLPPAPVSLAVFATGVSSAAAYGWVAEARRQRGGRFVATAFSLADLGSWDRVARLAANDFEDEVGRRHAEIAHGLAAARASDALIAQLSGSGATVFAIPRRGGAVSFGALPTGARVIEAATVASVEDVLVTR